jgi:hypothetical protein
MNKQKLAILITAGIGALSTLMPWAKLPIVGTVSGTQTELGWITFGLFAVSILMCLLKNKSNSLHGWILYGTIFPSLLASIFGIAKIIGFNAKMDEAKDKVKGTVIEKMSTFMWTYSSDFSFYLER